MILRAQIAFPFDTALPRDQVTINPHYFTDNADALADVLVNNLKAHTPIGALTPFTVKLYDAEKAPPNFPIETRVNGTGFTTTVKPREIAMCLSYYSTYNRPGTRGRLYIPGQFISGAFGLRPDAAQRTLVGQWADVLSQNMPANSNWVVWSRKQQQAYGVSNWWVDDEWDTVRSRGMRPTTRLEGVV